VRVSVGSVVKVFILENESYLASKHRITFRDLSVLKRQKRHNAVYCDFICGFLLNIFLCEGRYFVVSVVSTKCGRLRTTHPETFRQN
jgi:hypothetical protein